MRGRFAVFAAIAVAGLVLIGSAVALVSSVHGPASVAVPQTGAAAAAGRTLYVSPTGVDSNDCSKSAPCLGFDRAYDAAAAGDTVEIAAGEYAEQIITGSHAGTQPVLMRPAKGAAVSVAGFGIHADRLELRNIAAPGGLAVWGSSDFTTFRNLDLGSRLYIAGARDVKVIGGDVGPYVDGPSWITHDNGSPPQRVVIQGVHFHDFTVSDPSIHTECMLVVAGDGITFRGNRWTNCSVFDLSFGFCCDSPQAPTNVLIENNFFGAATSDARTTIHFNSNLPVANYTIRNNSAAGPFALDDNQPVFRNVNVIANVMPGSGCGRAKWSYNVTTGSKCPGVRNKLARSLGFRNADALDFHLSPSAMARNSGPLKGFAPTDIDGQKRPQGKKVEAGADELR